MDIKVVELELLVSKFDVFVVWKVFFLFIVIGGNGGFNVFDLDKWFIVFVFLVYNFGVGIIVFIFK